MNCKLTTQEMTTHKGFQWEIGKKEVITTEGGELCSPDYYHYYSDPLLAVFFNSAHANIINPRLFRVDVGGEILSDKGLKFGSKELELIEELELPEVTLTQRIVFGILCALEVNKYTEFELWATAWLDGTDRTENSAESATSWSTAAWPAAWAASKSAAWAAGAAESAAWAAWVAGFAAASADIDLIAIANKTMTYKD